MTQSQAAGFSFALRSRLLECSTRETFNDSHRRFSPMAGWYSTISTGSGSDRPKTQRGLFDSSTFSCQLAGLNISNRSGTGVQVTKLESFGLSKYPSSRTVAEG
jgi:hypothetical protein